MKKTVAMLLAVCMLLALAACGETDDGPVYVDDPVDLLETDTAGIWQIEEDGSFVVIYFNGSWLHISPESKLLASGYSMSQVDAVYLCLEDSTEYMTLYNSDDAGYLPEGTLYSSADGLMTYLGNTGHPDYQHVLDYEE